MKQDFFVKRQTFTVHIQFELIRSINNIFEMKQLNLTKIADANNTDEMCVLGVVLFKS